MERPVVNINNTALIKIFDHYLNFTYLASFSHFFASVMQYAIYMSSLYLMAFRSVKENSFPPDNITINGKNLNIEVIDSIHSRTYHSVFHPGCMVT